MRGVTVCAIKGKHVHHTWMCGDIDIGPNWAMAGQVTVRVGPIDRTGLSLSSQLSNVSRILFFLLPVGHD